MRPKRGNRYLARHQTQPPHQENPMRRNAQGWLGLGVATVAIVAALVAAQGTRTSERTESTELAVVAGPPSTLPRLNAPPPAGTLDNLEGRVYLHAVQAERDAEIARRAALKAAEDARKAKAAADAARASRSRTTSSGPTVGGDILDALARCESGSDPNKNTGNGYYGAFQFLPATWRSLGYSGLPTDHSYETQKEAARRLIARSGWGQFPGCARRLGMR